MTTQSQIFERMQQTIPANLWAQYNHLSFAEMAEQPELAEWADELHEAETAWFEADDA